MTPNQQRKINEFMRNLDIEPECIKHKNCIKIHSTESWEHFQMKAREAFMIYQMGRPVWTEAYRKDRSRKFDILDPLGDGIVEIQCKGEPHMDCDKEVSI
jgi:hypothetical protein